MPAALASTFGFDAVKLVFGAGCAEEVGEHVHALGVSRALVLCDRFLAQAGVSERVRASLGAAGVDCEVYDEITGEPDEASVAQAAAVAREGFDGFVAVGGGSALDTAKLCALFATHGGELMEWVNAPLGEGRAVPGPLMALVAIPTTAGTGSEATSVAVVDLPSRGTKSGVSHRHLRPSLAIVDPLLTLSCPPAVTAAVGLDALAHALEAYTCRPFDSRPHLPAAQRPPYQGSTPFSDVLCERAIALAGRWLRTAVASGDDVEARTGMSLAATTAGIAFASAGVHLPHALSYPIASLAHDTSPVPHGFAVAVSSPAAYRFIEAAAPARCAAAAALLDGGDCLADSFERLMRDVGAPARLSEIGLSADDLPALVAGALEQRRLLVGSPRPAGAVELELLLREAL